MGSGMSLPSYLFSAKLQPNRNEYKLLDGELWLRHHDLREFEHTTNTKSAPVSKKRGRSSCLEK